MDREFAKAAKAAIGPNIRLKSITDKEFLSSRMREGYRSGGKPISRAGLKKGLAGSTGFSNDG